MFQFLMKLGDSPYSRVAALKRQSLQHLELCSAVLLAKLMAKCTDSLKLNSSVNVFCWTDSIAVLSYNCWKAFVGNCI
jgi:hypothetical protein